MSNSIEYAKDQPQGFVNKIQNVALIGSTGQMGSHIIEQLTKNSQFKITALTRKGSKSSNQKQKGVDDIKEVDYDQEESIVEALKGQDVLIVTLAVTAPQDLPNRLVDAAVKAGIRWYIPNDWGYEMEHNPKANQESIIGTAKAAHRDYLTKKGLTWTTISCGFWYQWSLSGGVHMFGIDSKQRKANFYENGKISLTTSTWAQAAKAVAAFLSLPILPKDENDSSITMSKWKNDWVHVYSFRLNQRQMLDEVEKVTKTSDKDWKIEQVDVEKVWQEAFERLQKGDSSAFGICLYSRHFFSDSPGDVEDKCLKDMNLLGLKADESLEDATKQAVDMAEEEYLQKFFTKLHSQ